MACLNGKKGVELQLKAEKKTHTIAKPYPSFIPTIVYDEVREKENYKNYETFTEFRSFLVNFLARFLFYIFKLVQ